MTSELVVPRNPAGCGADALRLQHWFSVDVADEMRARASRIHDTG